MADLLVVDDDPDLREVLAAVLVAANHHVRVARNGREALDLLDERLPDAVLLDVEMPILDGPDTAYQMFITDLGKDKIPIILLSAVVDLHLVAARVGTPYYLGKPYALDALIRLLDRVLAERQPPHPRRDETPRPPLC